MADMKLTNIFLAGFKSIDSQGQDIPLSDITLLLGANGSGKSNLVSFFKMLNFMTTGALQEYAGREGVSQLFYYGPKTTESIQFKLLFKSEKASDEYQVKLSYGKPDRIFVHEEEVSYKKQGYMQSQTYSPGNAGPEVSIMHDERPTSKFIAKLLSQIRVFHFHDTSDTAKIKNRGYIDDVRYLRSDAGNLAAFLRMLNLKHENYYERIIRHIRGIMPQFGDFVLTPLHENDLHVRLNWEDRDKRVNYLFGPDQISDGSLRFMALATLLLSPPQLLPKIIVLDEPELGLHPEAVAELAGMIYTASQHTQILVATQSPRLVDDFSADQIIIVERDEKTRSSRFKKLSEENLSDWLERYSLSELWEKNVLGGQP